MLLKIYNKEPKTVSYLKKINTTNATLVAESILTIVPFIFRPSGRDLKDKLILQFLILIFLILNNVFAFNLNSNKPMKMQ